MSKSKLPDLKELGEISGKLFNDLKKSICEVIDSYKQKRPSAHASKPKKEAPVKETHAKATKKPAAPKKTTKVKKTVSAKKETK